MDPTIRSAVVTGASSGIGRAYAERLAARGSDVVLVARDGDRLDTLGRQLAQEYGVRAAPLVADLADPVDCARLAEVLAADPPDLLVNNAGVAHYMSFAALPPERARELVDVNALAPVLLSRAVLPGMLERGSGALVNVASLLAFSGAAVGPFLPQRAVYAATKAFLVTFSQVLAAEVAGTGVRVQVCCPGVVRSELHSRQGLDMSQVPRMEPDLVARASLADLDRGVLVSIPGQADETVVERYLQASTAMTAASRATELPDRYGRGPGTDAAGGQGAAGAPRDAGA